MNYRHVKAVLDFVGAVVLLAVLGLPMLLIALIIRLDSRGPAIYRQTRMSRGSGHYTIYKFRTMKTGTPVLSTAEMQQQQEIPFTRIGPFLRKTNLDELPQLLNIVRGEMSFVGPRPALPTQDVVVALRRQSGADREKPGITGLAQVMGRDDLDDHTKVGYDTQYCDNLSLLADVKILLRTFGAVFSARGNK